MTPCLFATDLHGDTGQYQRLCAVIAAEQPAAVFLGGDLLPGLGHVAQEPPDFFPEVLVGGFSALREQMKSDYPRVFLILGNDDPRAYEDEFQDVAQTGLWDYIHNRHLVWGGFDVYGCSFVPPTPFLNKDWERYDVSRFVDPGCVSPEEGFRSVPIDPEVIRHETILDDLRELTHEGPLDRAVILLHTPPYKTALDRADLDGRMVDHVPLDVNVGSIAVRRLIEARQPLVTLHGHIHESARLTGAWRDKIGQTEMFSAAHDGPELALVRFDLDNPKTATRELIAV